MVDTPGNEKKQEDASSLLGKLLSPKPLSSSSLLMKEIWMKPCIEFAIRTLRGEIPCIGGEKRADDTTPQSSLSSSAANRQFSSSGAEMAAFGDVGGGIWAADPCIEFAVKILTGKIPISSVDVSAPEKPSVYAQHLQQCLLLHSAQTDPYCEPLKKLS
ncbi:unnamed protein product [Cuscuta epithymum]|uniref:Uncharacterized protein n=1 Tax=Cuscuta epithymum TaxID=186058 RepID=A0AAV0EEL0_9ASTE|nr:unnamed protein product [Cuscuta epithymum]